MNPRRRRKNKNPALGRVWKTQSRTRDSYPAGSRLAGRRARDVIPAAMRALVRMKRWAMRRIIGRRDVNWLSGRLNDDTDVLRIATRG